MHSTGAPTQGQEAQQHESDEEEQINLEKSQDTPKSERATRIAEELLHLPLIEVYDVADVLRQRLGLPLEAMFSAGASGAQQPQAAAPSTAAGGTSADAASGTEEDAAAQQSTFTVKLDNFDDASKIKVIKEVRAAAELGLKEAKELVSSLPAKVKAGVRKEEADALKQKLEDAGASVSLT